MANIAELCASLPKEWVTSQEHRAHREELRLQHKKEWKCEKRKGHQRLLAYRDREAKRRAMHGDAGAVTLGRSREVVRRQTMPTMLRPETTAEIFYAGKGVRTHKKARNNVSSEEMGTVRPHITVKRFDGSRFTCVCKTKMIFA